MSRALLIVEHHVPCEFRSRHRVEVWRETHRLAPVLVEFHRGDGHRKPYRSGAWARFRSGTGDTAANCQGRFS